MDSDRNSVVSNEEGASGPGGPRDCPNNTRGDPETQALVVDLDEPTTEHIHHFGCPPSAINTRTVHHFHHQHCPHGICGSPVSTTRGSEADIDDLNQELGSSFADLSLGQASRSNSDRAEAIGRGVIGLLRETQRGLQSLRRQIRDIARPANDRGYSPTRWSEHYRRRATPGNHSPTSDNHRAGPYRRRARSSSRSSTPEGRNLGPQRCRRRNGWSDWEPVTIASPTRSPRLSRPRQRETIPGRWSDWEPMTVLSPQRRTRPDRPHDYDPGCSRAPVFRRLPQGDTPTNAQVPRSVRQIAGGDQFTAEQIRNTNNYFRREIAFLRITHHTLTAARAWNLFVNRLIRYGLYWEEAEVVRAWEIAFDCDALVQFEALWGRPPRTRSSSPEGPIRLQDLIRF